jgi:hypothetical protein
MTWRARVGVVLGACVVVAEWAVLLLVLALVALPLIVAQAISWEARRVTHNGRYLDRPSR